MATGRGFGKSFGLARLSEENLLRATEYAQAHRAIGALRMWKLRRLAVEVLPMPASRVQLGAQLLLAMLAQAGLAIGWRRPMVPKPLLAE